MTRQQLTRGIAAVIVAIGGFAVVNASKHAERNEFCAGVGLTTDTYGATPEEALVAYVRSRGGSPKYWKLSGASTFEITDKRATPKGLVSIGAREESPGVWRVTGGCVGNRPLARSPSSIPPPDRTTCALFALRVTATEGRTHAPFATWEFAITNDSKRSCEVEGYPRVTVFQNAYQLSFGFERRSGVLVAAPEPEVVTLAPGATAHFVLEKDACSAYDQPPNAHADLYFTGAGRVTVAVPGRFVYCTDYGNDPILQTAVVAEIADAYLPSPATPRCREKDLELALAGAAHHVTGFEAWVVRLINAANTPCELSGKPVVSIGGNGGPIFGIKAARAARDRTLIRGGPVSTLTLRPSAAAYLAFEKRACVKAEQPITAISMQAPGGGSEIVPLPEGLAKCDFKEADANVVWFSPFLTSANAAFI